MLDTYDVLIRATLPGATQWAVDHAPAGWLNIGERHKRGQGKQVRYEVYWGGHYGYRGNDKFCKLNCGFDWAVKVAR